MSATPEDVTAATTEEAPPAPDGSTEQPKSAESAPAVENDADEITRAAKGVGKRIDELTRNWRETQRDRDYWRELALNGHRQPEPKPQVEEDPKPGKTLADFEHDEGEYQRYLFSVAQSHAVKAAKEELRREEARRAAAVRDAEFSARADKFAEDVKDFYDVTRNDSLSITAEMAESIKDSEHGPAIAYHLGKNPRIAEQISRLPPLQQAREIGRIEAKLSEKPKTPVVSTAPPPAPTLAATQSEVEKDPEKMSDGEWLAWRNKQLARQRRK